MEKMTAAETESENHSKMITYIFLNRERKEESAPGRSKGDTVHVPP